MNRKSQVDFGFAPSGIGVAYGCQGMQEVRMRLIRRYPQWAKHILAMPDALALRDDFAVGELIAAHAEAEKELRRLTPVHGCLTRKQDRVRRRKTERRVYFVRSKRTGLIKIGVSCDVQNRVRELQNASGSPLRILATEPGDLDLERERHRQFAAARVRGEWFRPVPALLEHIAGLVKN